MRPGNGERADDVVGWCHSCGTVQWRREARNGFCVANGCGENWRFGIWIVHGPPVSEADQDWGRCMPLHATQRDVVWEPCTQPCQLLTEGAAVPRRRTGTSASRPRRAGRQSSGSHDGRTSMSLDDLRRALLDLETGRIDHDTALGIVWRDQRPLYQRRDFRNMRAQRIGDACSQCGTRTGPLVLQHLQQPLDLKWALRSARSDAMRKYEEGHPRPRYDDLPQIETPVCPRCGRIGFYRRITLALPFRCPYHDCRHEFREPGIRREPDPHLARERWSEYVRGFEAECSSDYKREAASEYIRSRISYLEGAHVTTMCKKCAYLADAHGMVLCECCRQHYHARRFSLCWPCKQLPVNHQHPASAIGAAAGHTSRP